MIKIGLTGSIGMGKSTTTAMFAAEGVPIFDADLSVRDLFRSGGRAVESVRALYPTSIVEGAVDRSVLSKIILHDNDKLTALERAVSPHVRELMAEFIAANQAAPVVLLDVPLLFEAGLDSAVDFVLVVTCPYEMQKARVLARPNMTEEKFAFILSRQLPSDEKCKRADKVIDTSKGVGHVKSIVLEVLDMFAVSAI